MGCYALGLLGIINAPNGNMLTRNDGTTTWNYTWTKENMLRQAAGGSTTVTFTYDGDGQLVRRSDQTGQITTILGHFYQATTYAATETSQTTSHYLFNGQLVAQRVGTSFHYFLTDHLGSTTTTLYPNGQLEATLRYDPWGNTRYSQNTTPTSYRYTSQRQDSPLGLYDYHARYYDPVISRFLSPDSIIPNNANNIVGPNSEQRLTPLTVAFHETAFLLTANEETRQLMLNGPVATWNNDQKQEFHVPTGPTSPQLLNRYTYVLNAPLSYTDPTGHDSGGNETIGYEQLYDDKGNPIYDINGNPVYKIWYDDQVKYVSNSADLASFKLYAQLHAEADGELSMAIILAIITVLVAFGAALTLPTIISAILAGTAVTIVLPIVGPITIGVGILALIAVLEVIALVAAAFAEVRAAWNLYQDRLNAANNAWDRFNQMPSAVFQIYLPVIVQYR